jgi:tetratricopeptide (TPR) repeat protein
MGKESKARQQKGKLFSFIPTGEYYFTKGLKAYNRRDFHKAKKYLQRAMQLEPGEPMIMCQLAIVWTEIGEYENANRLLHTIIEEIDEDMSECHYFLANNYAHMGFFKDAHHHAKLYLKFEPDGDFVEEIEDLLELLTLESDELEGGLYEQDDLMYKQEQARDLLESGYFPKAIELLNEVIVEFPEYWSAYNNLALAYFYLGETEKAAGILNDVLDKNPGNLHALCNRLVFAHYLKMDVEVEELTNTLRKINPLMAEQQFKLGATFALIGEYELAYLWLKKLYKHGYEGEGPFYYWLAYSAFHTGKEAFARNVWKIVLEINPEKEGLEPWNEDKAPVNGFEDHIGSIIQRLESDYEEERLFALFLTSVSQRKAEILASDRYIMNGRTSQIEKDYLSFVKSGKKAKYSFIAEAHEVAELLYERFQPIGTVEAGLYLMWFTVYVEWAKTGGELKNKHAWAAAIEYVWMKLRREKVSQQTLAESYDLSISTVGKYVKSVNNLLK